MNRVVIPTKLGSLRIGFSPRGVTGVEFLPARRRQRDQAPAGPAFLRCTIRDLREYARGQPVVFRVPLDLSGGTVFQQKVWRALCRIPRGQTRSYAWVARQIGRPRATRAVGAACGANPVPVIVPCHRVIASDGSLGGFSAGLPLKIRLLKFERVEV